MNDTLAPSRTHSPMMPKSPTLSSLSSSPKPGTLRRRSSTLEAFQDVQSALKSSTEHAMAPTAPETGFWNSVPLAFALLPAVAGVFFTNGHVFVGDFILLALSAWFLHWLIKFPWEWYHESQSIGIPDQDPFVAIIEEDEDEAELDSSNTTTNLVPGVNMKSTHKFGAKDAATRELERNQNLALLCCFIGPLLGGYLLHTIRHQLSHSGESLLSTFNITVFVLGAELRPSAQVLKLIRNRGRYLQSIVHHPPVSKVMELQNEIYGLREQIDDLISRKGLVQEDEVLGSLRAGMQPDLDALTRAVRKYERKDSAQRLENETRFNQLEQRIQDAISLAALTAATAQANQGRQSLVWVLMRWLGSILSWPFVWMWRLAVMPKRLVESMTTGRKLLWRAGTSPATTSKRDGSRQRQFGDRKGVRGVNGKVKIVNGLS